MEDIWVQFSKNPRVQSDYLVLSGRVENYSNKVFLKTTL